MTESAALLSPELPAPGDALWRAMTANYAADEAEALKPLLDAATLPMAERDAVLARAARLSPSARAVLEADRDRASYRTLAADRGHRS